ncbi:MAG: hypothetical protein MI922_27985, partial [Bacteroidales bacterium]|nr:hypothetical protein [Bacteroidales bacterium]
LYVTPQEGSNYAYLVDDPLPIEFTVSSGTTTKVIPEIVSKDCKCTAEDFGYYTLQMDIIETIDFLMSVQVYDEKDENWKITNANLQILFNGDILYDNTTDSRGKIDVITIKDGYPNYTVKVMKNGYVTYEKVFTNTEMKKFTTEPLNVLLQKGAIKLVDIDGNVYRTTNIGNQVWMAEDLRTTRYADGTQIPNVDNRAVDDISGANQAAWDALPDDNTWANAAYCWYNNDSSKYSEYGALYTWAAAMGAKPGKPAVPRSVSSTTVQGVCPNGWHLPSAHDWHIMINFFYNNETESVPTLLKASRDWKNHGNDPYGFSALPSGGRYGDGSFKDFGSAVYWWIDDQNAKSLPFDPQYSIYYGLTNHPYSYIENEKENSFGACVRCVKD